MVFFCCTVNVLRGSRGKHNNTVKPVQPSSTSSTRSASCTTKSATCTTKTTTTKIKYQEARRRLSLQNNSTRRLSHHQIRRISTADILRNDGGVDSPQKVCCREGMGGVLLLVNVLEIVQWPRFIILDPLIAIVRCGGTEYLTSVVKFLENHIW